ncbi:MAG: hypothetical protein SVO01_06350 [Thermotogota bacterium]|nr:hypothetical protein [Thermotogota bacterium]
MTYSPPIDHRFLLTKLHKIQQDLVDDQNLPSWLLESASVASFVPWDAVKLYNAIISSNLEPKIDSYSSFAMYLIDLLNFGSFELFEKLIDDHINIFMGQEYDSNEKREQVIFSLKNTVRLWLNGGNYLQISTENDQYKKNTITKKWKRSSAQANIPKVFKWIKEVAGRLSRYGGLFFAIKEKWITNQPASIPSWLENSRSIGTLSLGIKNGVNSPEALACYESILHERIMAKILSESTIHQLINCDEIDDRHLFANKVLTEFLTEAHNGVFSDPILENLEQVVNQHAQND